MTSTPAKTSTERVRRFRQRRAGEYSRMEIYLSPKVRVGLKRLSGAWKLSRQAVIERLVLEAAARHRDELLPETGARGQGDA